MAAGDGCKDVTSLGNIGHVGAFSLGREIGGFYRMWEGQEGVLPNAAALWAAMTAIGSPHRAWDEKRGGVMEGEGHPLRECKCA